MNVGFIFLSAIWTLDSNKIRETKRWTQIIVREIKTLDSNNCPRNKRWDSIYCPWNKRLDSFYTLLARKVDTETGVIARVYRGETSVKYSHKIEELSTWWTCTFYNNMEQIENIVQSGIHSPQMLKLYSLTNAYFIFEWKAWPYTTTTIRS